MTSNEEVTPVFVVACLDQLVELGYEYDLVFIDPGDLGIGDDDDGEKEIASWRPKKPSGDGWFLHFKHWVESAEILAVWVRETKD